MAPTAQASDVLSAVRDWLAQHGEQVLDEMTDQLIADLPEVTETGEDGAERLRRSVLSHVPGMLAAFGPDPPAVRLPAIAEEWARGMARGGAPLGVLVRSYEVGHAILWRQMADALRELPPLERADTLEAASSRMFDYVHGAAALSVTVYTRELARLERRATSQRARTIAEVLAGTLDEVTAEQALGYRLASKHVGYVAWATEVGDVDALAEAVAALRERVRSWQHVGAPIDDMAVQGWFAVKDDEWQAATENLELAARIGLACGTRHAGADGFRITHREALEARRVAQLLGITGRRVAYADVAVMALASRDSDQARAFVERELGPLLTDDAQCDRLLATLEVYLRTMASPTTTGRELGVHANTVIKRLERIEALLERRIDTASLSLRLAVELAPLARALPR